MRLTLTEPKTIFYDPKVYTSFPDIVLYNGSFLVIFRTGDSHHPEESSLYLARSANGEHWDISLFAHASIKQNGHVFNCPRINFINGILSVICDIKTSRLEREASWDVLAWWSKNGENWRQKSLGIMGMVPDKIIPLKNSLAMGYHVSETTELVIGEGIKRTVIQMMAESLDGGETWRDRKTIAVSDKHSFCEGSIVKLNDNKLFCFMRDNRTAILRSQVTRSMDGGKSWGMPKPMDIWGHRIVAGVKRIEPYAGSIIGTFRNTTNRTLSLFIINPQNDRTQVLSIDTETNENPFNYGYSGWVETDDGGLQIVYYIQRNKENPEVVTMKVILH